MLYDAAGTPTPPDSLIQRMRGIDPSLGVRFSPLPSGAQWAVTQRWGPEDKRRAMIRAGDMSPNDDHDIIAWIPVRLPLDEVPGWVARQWKQVNTEDVKRFLDRLDQENLEQTKASSAEALGEAMNVVEVMGSKLFKDIIDPVPKIVNAGLPEQQVETSSQPPTGPTGPTGPAAKKGKKK